MTEAIPVKPGDICECGHVRLLHRHIGCLFVSPVKMANGEYNCQCRAFHTAPEPQAPETELPIKDKGKTGYPFPLSDGQFANLQLPWRHQLSKEDADRLCKMIHALVTE